MSLNLQQAFSYVKNDSAWAKKILIGGLVMLVPTLVNTLSTIYFRPNQIIDLSIIILVFVLGIASIFLGMVATGYYVKTANSKITSDSKELPSWSDFGGLLGIGFKYFVGYFLFALPFFVLEIFSMIMIFANIKENLGLAAFWIVISTFITIIMLLLAFLMISNYAKHMKISSFVNYKQAFELVKGNAANYFTLILFNLLIGLIFAFASFILDITKIGIILVPFITFYLTLVSANLIAQFVKTKES